jgi:hypothetical protein
MVRGKHAFSGAAKHPPGGERLFGKRWSGLAQCVGILKDALEGHIEYGGNLKRHF